MNKQSLIKKALNHYGHENQILQFYEELNELGAAVNHNRRNKIDKPALILEVADVLFMLEYIKLMFNITDKQIEDSIQLSMQRLETKIINNQK